MSVLSPRAEQKLKELNKTLTPHSRNILATFDEHDQVRWIVNPKLQYILDNQTQSLLKNNADKSNRKTPLRTGTPLPETSSDCDDHCDY